MGERMTIQILLDLRNRWYVERILRENGGTWPWSFTQGARRALLFPDAP